MSLGLGEGGEQNAPLGRAVIGGLVFATISTLLFVPVVYAAVHLWLIRRKERWLTKNIPSGAPAS
jgi:Cu/Ag efflux pump CusA